MWPTERSRSDVTDRAGFEMFLDEKRAQTGQLTLGTLFAPECRLTEKLFWSSLGCARCHSFFFSLTSQMFRVCFVMAAQFHTLEFTLHKLEKLQKRRKSI